MKKKRKKNYAEPEMGYCPLSIRQPSVGLGSLGARGARRAGSGARGERGAAAGAGRTRHAGLGAAWACCWASRLCTQPVLTQFRLSIVPESIFGEIFFKNNNNK